MEKVEIISISGVRESLTSNGNNNYDMSSYASGMYIIKTTLSNNTMECFKIVKI
ncbi:T9SS type A sorting domain-containing protein [Flavicella sp.]|uniref:T9SS type A sorting domain-containing protein n=1 Tax=Flavicella sp. TaxID=2957742 RepID=UPI0034458756